jgi:hypothetical protein
MDMNSDVQGADTAWGKLEAATKTLEKESLFFSALASVETSARIVNRIVLLIPLYRLVETDIPPGITV